MNKNAATEREYEFSYDTLVDIITAQQALIEELTHTIFAKEKELEKNTDLLNDAKWLIDDLMYACEMNEIIFDFPEKDLSYCTQCTTPATQKEVKEMVVQIQKNECKLLK